MHISRRHDTDTTAENLLKGLSTRGKLLPTREGGAPLGAKGGGIDTPFDRLLPARAEFWAFFLVILSLVFFFVSRCSSFNLLKLLRLPLSCSPPSSVKPSFLFSPSLSAIYPSILLLLLLFLPHLLPPPASPLPPSLYLVSPSPMHVHPCNQAMHLMSPREHGSPI